MLGNVSRFRILALSGGGFRNLFTARVLARLEHEVGGNLASRFDLIAGTGMGSVLALGLSLGIRAADLVRLFERHGIRISAGKFGTSAQASNASLHALLSTAALFGAKTLAECRTAVIVPAVSRTTGRPVIFKTPHHPDFGNCQESLVDVALASGATPGLFHSHAFGGTDYCDGGLVANAPGLLAVHEAERYFGVPRSAVHVLSIGAMSAGRAAIAVEANPKKPRWPSWFGPPPAAPTSTAFELSISAQESLVENQLRQLVPMGQFHHLDEAVPEGSGHLLPLDRTDVGARNVLLRSGDRCAKRFLACPDARMLLRVSSAPTTFFAGPRAFFCADTRPIAMADKLPRAPTIVVPIRRD